MSISIEGMNETSDFETSLERLKDVEPQDNWTEEDWKHFETIKLALKKQIPQKYAVWNGQCCCPNCNVMFGNYDDFKLLKSCKMDYCKFCGQALDWKD